MRGSPRRARGPPVDFGDKLLTQPSRHTSYAATWPVFTPPLTGQSHAVQGLVGPHSGIGLPRKGSERSPANMEIRSHLAKALAKQGSHEEAWEPLREIMSNPAKFSGREDAKSLLEKLEN